MKAKLPQYLVDQYNTDDEALIALTKSTDLTPKARSIGSNKPVRVPMSQDQCKGLCDQAGVEYLSGYETRVLQYTITDETVDRYGDIVKADGGQFDNYKKNAVIMTFHDYKQFPIGAAIRVWPDLQTRQVKAWVLIMDDRTDPTGASETAYRMASSGFMKAGSIGFMPKDIYRPTLKERQDLGMSDYGVIFKAWELMEFSLCGVPANPNAVQNSIERGVMQQKDLALLQKELGDSGDTFTEFLTLVKEAIAPEEVTEEVKPPEPLSIAEEIAKAFASLGLEMKPATVEKAGAVLSKKNKDLIQAAVDKMASCSTQMIECCTMLTDLLTSVGDNGDSLSTSAPTTTPTIEEEAGGKSVYDAEFDKALEDFRKSFKQ